MKDEEPAAAPVTAMAAEDEDEDLPDWLKDDEPATAPVTAMAADDEEDDALAWLDSKAGEQGISAGAIASDVLTPESPPRPVDSLMPDPDAVAEAADDEDLPDWLKDVEISSEGAPVAAASALTDLDDEIEVEEGDLDWLDEAIGEDDEAEIGDLDALFGDEEEEEAEEEAPLPAAPAAPPPIPEPEPTASWALLDADGEPEAVDVGLEAFLKTVESDEEEAPSPAPAPSTAPPAPVPAASAPPRSTSLLPEYRQEAIPVSDFGAKLAEARTAKDGGDTSTALTAYEALVSNGQMLDETVEDLRDLLRDKPSARANRVLGDALSAKGNIQEALDYYRRALDEL
jgi:tetratricopeptide (TPR) repeat protein